MIPQENQDFAPQVGNQASLQGDQNLRFQRSKWASTPLSSHSPLLSLLPQVIWKDNQNLREKVQKKSKCNISASIWSARTVCVNF